MFSCTSGTGCSGFYVIIFVERVVRIAFYCIAFKCADLRNYLEWFSEFPLELPCSYNIMFFLQRDKQGRISSTCRIIIKERTKGRFPRIF